MKRVALVVSLGLVACNTNTKTPEELSFPLGIHTWTKDQAIDEPPSDACTGCPGITLYSQNMAQLEASGWHIGLDPAITFLTVRGVLTNRGTSGCGANNNLDCSNEWRIWPPDADDSIYDAPTPGGELWSDSFEFDASFLCGTSRVVIVAENTYGITRLIFEVTRAGGVCQTALPGSTLNVRLVWDTDGTDLDLHLVRPGGTYGIDSYDDCNWNTCGTANSSGTSALDWGILYEGDDNPVLDVDDQGSRGPENVFLFAPEPGLYRIGVHYYDSYGVATYPAVEVYLDGVFQDMAFYGPPQDPSFTGGMIWHAADVAVGGDGAVTVYEVNTVSTTGL